MKKNYILNIRSQAIFSLLIAIGLLLPQAGFAASTGTAAAGSTGLLRQWGSAAPGEYGDYISASDKPLDTTHQYYIEVPSGLSQLVVDFFDPDCGTNGATSNDYRIGSSGTTFTYYLYSPAGGAPVRTRTSGQAWALNNVWCNFHTVASPAAGHWRVVISSLAGGDDMNGYGIRAHDGTSGSGGTEINMYGYSFVSCGWVGTGSFTSTRYPYITSGCTMEWNDWDGDNLSQHTLRSRNGQVSTTFNGSLNNAWLNTPVSNYDRDLINNETGIWTWTGRYTDTNNPSGAGNYGILYAGNYNYGSPPPTSQPLTDTFRIYFPTDAGGVPSKPVISQKLSFISGSNPPAVGSTTRIRVELIVFNPAAQSISISQLTSYVPGGGVVYAGNPEASQGSYSTPGIGGTGAVTWNPGTVNGSNNYATLYYEVDVTPPDGARLPVTGSPAANGTSATYLDETGTTFTYGPLCGLAVTAGESNIPTWVAISCFEADTNSGQPAVEWHTAAENGTVGFYLWRQDAESKDYQRVNPDLLPALANAMTGGIYRLVDPNSQYGETVVYRLEEINARGESLNYGPFTVTFSGTAADPREGDNFYRKNSEEIPTDISGFQSEVFTASEYEKSRIKSRSNVLRSRLSPVSASGGEGRVKITVKDRGLFYIDTATIGAALGKSLSQVEGLIASHALSLSNLGEPVAWLAAADLGGIYFYGEKLQNPYSDQNIYWLEPGWGMAFAAVSGGNAAPAVAGQTFNISNQFEENLLPLTSLFTSPDDDFWFWDLIVAGGKVKVIPMRISHPATAGTAILTVNLHGASDTAAVSEHHVRFFLNKVQIGESWWDGITAHTCQFNVNQSILQHGKNTFVVSGLLDSGVKYSYFYLDSFDLSYQQYYQATNNTLWCQGDANQTISVTGFTDAQIMVLDISQPKQPRLVSTTSIDPAGRLTFNPETPTNQYLLIGMSAVSRPFSIQAASPGDVKSDKPNVEYLLIAPREFADVSQQLAAYRQSQGLEAAVVTLEDIYDSFNWGLASPLAIKDFLNFHYGSSDENTLKYLVLVGRGTFDYKNYLGCGDNLLPPLLAGTPDGLFAADNLFGDLNNDDGIPEIAIGRLPVVSVAELSNLINKIKSYGSSGGEWTDKALLIADNADSGGNFFFTSESLGNQLKGYALERFTLLGRGNASKTRSEIIAGFNHGAALVNYVGHGGLNQLTEENIFNITDLKYLVNSDRFPVMVFVTCAAGRFDIPGFVSLSEALVLKEYAGIVAALAPSSASYNSEAELLFEEFYKAAFSAKEKDLGSAWLAAAKNFIYQGGKPHLLNIHNLIGDPAVMFK